jgi:hypothetical protein
MKKKLPLELIKGFRPQENPNYHLVRYTTGDGFIIKFIDNDEKSDFFFQIERVNDRGQFLIVFKPSSNLTINAVSSWSSIETVNAKFKYWLNIIYEYNNTDTIFDDPIIISFSSEFFNEFKFTDPEANYAPFKYDQILFLEGHLNKIEKGLIEFRNDENTEVIDEILEETKELKADLVKKSRNQIIKKLAILWAKLLKNGVPIIKEFLKEGFKETMKIGIKA